MPSATKAAVLQQHDQNNLLNTPAPPLMPDSGRDLRVPQPRGQVSEEIIAASTAALRSGQTHYVDVPGIGPLREALAAYLQKTYDAAYGSANVLVTAGVQESRFLTLQKIGEQFERISIPAVVHPGVRRALGTRPLQVKEMAVDSENGYLPSLDSMRQALEGGSRLLYLESPSRLTGKAFGADLVSSLAEMLQAFEAGLILDHGLAPWVPDGNYYSPTAAPQAAENVAVLGEAWPGMGLDSWFIAYIATPEKWFEPMRSQKQIMAICTSTAAQYAALEAAQSFQESRTAQLEKLLANRARTAEAVRANGLSLLPGDAASVIAIRFSDNGATTPRNTLQQAGYEVANGEHFGAPGILSVAVTVEETSMKALQRLS